MKDINYTEDDLERLESLCEQFRIAAAIRPKLYHAIRVAIDPADTRSSDPSQGWDEFLSHEHCFAFGSHERAYCGTHHTCFYGAEGRLKEYTGLAAAGFGLLSRDLCAMTDSHRNAQFDRDVWTLALYRIAMHLEYQLPIDRKGNGDYAKTEAHQYPWLRSVITDQSANADREKVNLLEWQAEAAMRTGKAPRFVYASLGLDVFESSLIAAQFLRTKSQVAPPLAFPLKVKHDAANSSSPETAQAEQPTGPVKPHWDSSQGILYVGGVKVRKKLALKARTVRKILDEFEAKGWPPRIESPFFTEGPQNGGSGHKRIPDPVKRDSALAGLRDGLTMMEFHAEGTEIYWILR